MEVYQVITCLVGLAPHLAGVNHTAAMSMARVGDATVIATVVRCFF